jgi:DNA-directed RNA polymerase subunit K/omega
MEQKKYRIESTAVTRDISDFVKHTNNIYETIAILSKRANQISTLLKEELNQKIQEFSTPGDTLEEVFENREQIEVAKHYEQLPKPTLIAINEYLNDKIYYRNPAKEKSENNF